MHMQDQQEHRPGLRLRLEAQLAATQQRVVELRKVHAYLVAQRAAEDVTGTIEDMLAEHVRKTHETRIDLQRLEQSAPSA